MCIYVLEPRGIGNTAKYVRNIINKNPERLQVFTSSGNQYSENTGITLFGKYNKSSGLSKLLLYIVGWVRILNTMTKGQVLHIHWLKVSIIDYAFLFSIKLKGIKIIVTIHNILPHEQRFFDRFFFSRIYRMVDFFIFHTQGIKNCFEKEFFECSNFRIIDHYYDPVVIKPALEDPKIILFFGNIRPYKGLELLIEAIKSLDNVYLKDWRLVIAGRPEYDISKLISETSEFKNIIWKTEYISDTELEYMFNTAGVVALPYHKIDTSGLLYLAKSYGKLVIAPDMGIFSEKIEHLVDGLLFEPGNVQDLSKQISVALDQDAFHRMKKNIISNLPDDSIGSFAKQHEKVYSSLKIL